ncbi:hypothetical protein LCGC14_2772880 [marine sediment metagenome]|uniref:Uncharacterized protein n=1 Tax=marine sediment metagenome TaxID=412755 RepID=A0A0F8ZHH4_9ZZZZ
MQIGNKDKEGNTLRLGGWKADVWQTPYNRFRVTVGDNFSAYETEEEAVKLYNDLNNTKLKVLPQLPIGTGEKPPAHIPFPEGSKLLGVFESKSEPGTFHYTIQYPSGEISCTCKGSIHGSHWHTDLIKDILSQGIVINKPIVVSYTKEVPK